MSATVTLLAFSGRADVTWRLDDAELFELRDQIAERSTPTDRKASGVLGRLGYRGFLVEADRYSALGSLSFLVHEGLADPGRNAPSLDLGDRSLERWLLDSGGNAPSAALRQHVLEQLDETAPSFDDFVVSAAKCPACVAADAPAYDPSRWNTPAVQPFNNCYNYANDQITNTFAQPGRASGTPMTGMSCAGVQPSAVSDGLRTAANFTTPLAKGKGWYVALVIWPGEDYHWYRQDSSGCWSHKAGGTPATNLDNAGNEITDPQTCDRGPYTSFCSYMITDANVVIQ